jgi:hypothetical protein
MREDDLLAITNASPVEVDDRVFCFRKGGRYAYIYPGNRLMHH